MLACAEFGGISRYFCMCHVIGRLEARWKVDVRVECLLPDVEGLDPLGWVHVVYYVHAMDPPLCHTLQDTQPLSLQWGDALISRGGGASGRPYLSPVW